MIELEKRISGDWIDLREKINDIFGLIELLDLSVADLRTIVDKLRLSVEQGIIEFKKSTLSPVLAALEAVRYKSLDVEVIREQERILVRLLLVVLIQRLIALELIPPVKTPEKREFGIEDMQVNVILSDVNTRIKGNPALRSHPAIKNILMQVQLYNKENQKLKELLPTIRPEMRTSFLRNFTKTFNGIVGSIRRHYVVLLQEEAAAKGGKRDGFSLSLLPLKELGPIINEQAREFSRIRSTLAHARDEKYKTREILVRLYDKRQDAIRMIEDELAVYGSLCRSQPNLDAESCVQGLMDEFRTEIAVILEKQIKREAPPAAD